MIFCECIVFVDCDTAKRCGFVRVNLADSGTGNVHREFQVCCIVDLLVDLVEIILAIGSIIGLDTGSFDRTGKRSGHFNINIVAIVKAFLSAFITLLCCEIFRDDWHYTFMIVITVFDTNIITIRHRNNFTILIIIEKFIYYGQQIAVIIIGVILVIISIIFISLGYIGGLN